MPLANSPELLPRPACCRYTVRKMLVPKRTILASLMAIVLITAVPMVSADSATTSQGIVQSYVTAGTVHQGMIVGSKKSDNGKVSALTYENISDMFGVAISATDAPITLSGDSPTQVYVATSGEYNVLVSDQNGAIKTGDYISISTLNGIGMKAQDTEPTVVGRAAADLTDKNIIQAGVQVKSGTKVIATVSIGAIPVNISVTNNPKGGHGTGNLPGFLQVAAGNIADKPVTAGRVYLSLAVLVLAAFIAGSLLYSGVRGSLLAIGRNPLAKKYIIRGLIQTILTGVIVFILGLFAVYLLLRL